MGLDAYAEYASTGLPQPPSPDDALRHGLRRRRFGGRRFARSSATAERPAPSRSQIGQIRRLAAACDLVLPLHAGEEAGGVASRTYHATVAVLQLLAARLAGDDAAPVIARIRRAAESLDVLLASRDA